MSVLDTLKSLIGRANKDIEENLSKEAESVEEAADSIQTSSEEEIETKSDSETISEEEATDVPIEEVAEAEEEVLKRNVKFKNRYGQLKQDIFHLQIKKV